MEGRYNSPQRIESASGVRPALAKLAERLGDCMVRIRHGFFFGLSLVFVGLGFFQLPSRASVIMGCCTTLAGLLLVWAVVVIGWSPAQDENRFDGDGGRRQVEGTADSISGNVPGPADELLRHKKPPKFTWLQTTSRVLSLTVALVYVAYVAFSGPAPHPPSGRPLGGAGRWN